MINLSRHEDDEPLIAKEDIKATVVKKQENDAIEVILPEIPDQTFFIHQPEAPKKK